MSVPTAAERRQLEVVAYGRSLLLDDGDLVLDAGALREVEGLDNLQQGLVLRIQTPWAGDRLNATYGLDVSDVFTAGLPRDLTKEVLRLNLIRTLSGDPRVSTVDQVLFDDDPAYLAAHPGAAGAARDRRQAMVEVTLTPVPAGAATGVTATALAAAATGDSRALGAVTVLVDVRW